MSESNLQGSIQEQEKQVLNSESGQKNEQRVEVTQSQAKSNDDLLDKMQKENKAGSQKMQLTQENSQILKTLPKIQKVYQTEEQSKDKAFLTNESIFDDKNQTLPMIETRNEKLFELQKQANEIEKNTRSLSNRINLLKKKDQQTLKQIYQSQKKLKEFKRSKLNTERSQQEKSKFYEMKMQNLIYNKNYINQLREERKVGKGELKQRMLSQKKAQAYQMKEKSVQSDIVLKN